jgi:hypothetical protein
LPCSARSVRDGVALQRLALVLGVGVVDRVAAAHAVDRLLEQLTAGAAVTQRLAEIALLLARGEHEELAGDEAVATLLGQLVGHVEQP